MNSRHAKNRPQFNDPNIARAWASLNLPVLALIGEYDIRTLPMDHEFIAAIGECASTGKRTWRVMPSLNHGVAEPNSLKDAVAHELASAASSWKWKVLQGYAIEAVRIPLSGSVAGFADDIGAVLTREDIWTMLQCGPSRRGSTGPTRGDR